MFHRAAVRQLSTVGVDLDVPVLSISIQCCLCLPLHPHLRSRELMLKQVEHGILIRNPVASTSARRSVRMNHVIFWRFLSTTRPLACNSTERVDIALRPNYHIIGQHTQVYDRPSYLLTGKLYNNSQNVYPLVALLRLGRGSSLDTTSATITKSR